LQGLVDLGQHGSSHGASPQLAALRTAKARTHLACQGLGGQPRRRGPQAGARQDLQAAADKGGAATLLAA
jgi:hypothetical protein